MFVVREINSIDKEAITQLIIEDWGSNIVVSRGKAHDVSPFPDLLQNRKEK